MFKNVVVKRKRVKSDWTQKENVYYGISFKVANEDESRPIELKNISSLAVSNGFFLTEQNDVYTKLGLSLAVSINNMKVFVEVKFMLSRQWRITAFQKVITPIQLGLTENTFEMNKKSILTVLNAVKQVKVCQGISLPPSHKSIQNALKEISSENGENQKITYRSMDCASFLSLKTPSSKKCCKFCKSLLCEDEKHSVRVPMQDITNTVTSNNTSSSSKSMDSEEIQNKQTDQEVQMGENVGVNYTEESVTLCQEDQNDMQIILGSLIKECPPKMVEFLKSQQKALNISPYGNRWSKTLIRICLTLWCRSPKAYGDLKDSGLMVLPSQRLLQIYKNRIHQRAGVNKELLHWMQNEALLKNVPEEGKEGGLMLDEMSIQTDLQMYCKNGKHYIIGFKEESDLMECIKSGKCELKMATHVLQFVFLGFTGFRFPIFHYPTVQASACDLYLEVWRTIDLLKLFGFTVRYISTDGAETNRDLAKVLLGEFSSEVNSMKIQNIFSYSEDDIFFIMDFSHVMKKLRNNVSKSGYGASHLKKSLYVNSHFIYWNHLYSAHIWDVSHNPFPVYHKLTHEHFFLTSESKMRNHLAEEVLNKEMLHLIECYAESLPDNSYLSSTIELLQHTSILVENFRDPRPIVDTSDNRLKENIKVLEWFRNWEKMIKSDKTITRKPESYLISHQTRADISSLIIGFQELCMSKLQKSGASIIPNRVNSDVIENVFSQQRGLYNGNNTNPTYLTYCRTMNAVILGQPTVSRKSNAGKLMAAADPYTK
ncbi:hypothetical protein FSP39_011714 [Pinctada imbricata]|uniref:Transposable element P transposase-like RNase H domain-containing protein n=1 Tax=Pinctada imbricata TaxID=66713 RepID=A0AA88Y837_PINIB|nr:hypothetical protein FSP39_011714 [Pinctada imbricata]